MISRWISLSIPAVIEDVRRCSIADTENGRILQRRSMSNGVAHIHGH
jgi:hypothetical protein